MSKSSDREDLYIFAYGMDIKIYTIIEFTGFNALSALIFYLIDTLFDKKATLLSLPLSALPSIFAIYLVLSFKRRRQGLYIDIKNNVVTLHDVFYNRYFKLSDINSCELLKKRYLDDLILRTTSSVFVFKDAKGRILFSFNCPVSSLESLHTLVQSLVKERKRS